MKITSEITGLMAAPVVQETTGYLLQTYLVDSGWSKGEYFHDKAEMEKEYALTREFLPNKIIRVLVIETTTKISTFLNTWKEVDDAK